MSEIKRNDWPELYEAPSGENSKKYIFISYSHEDAGIVYQDLKTLAANGARIWYDRAMHVGQNWIERARNKIQDKNCAAVLFYISTNSLQSSAILEELEYTLQRSRNDDSFSYMSVNIGEKTAFELLKSTDVNEAAFLKFLTAFSEDKLFIPRNSDPFHTDHILKLIEVFEEADAIDLSKCNINQSQLFEYSAFNQGIQITRYSGADSIISIPSLINGKKVLAIGINTFRGKEEIKKVNVPEGIQVIDDFAFSGCINLESITLPNSLTTLGYEVFRECYSLSEITIPYNVEVIGDYCFYKCHKLYTIRLLPINPLTIRFAAFSECHALEQLILPDTTIEIGPYAFNNCINLNNLCIPPNIQKIGLSAFYSCASLTSVRLKTVRYFENQKWFARCRNLNTIEVDAGKMDQFLSDPTWDSCRDYLQFKLDPPSNVSFEAGIISWDSVKKAEYYTVTINGEQYESMRPLYNAPQLEGHTVTKVTVRACSYENAIIDSDESSEITIELSANTFEVECAENEVILKKYNRKSPIVVIPDNITVIGAGAFYNHEEIREIRFPRGLKRIEDKAFYHCLNLMKMQLPDGLTDIGDEAFWGVSVKELVIPESVRRLGKSCFACCNDLAELSILSSGVKADVKAFYRCVVLKKVNFPNGIDELANGMFRGCTELDSLVLPSGLKAIRSGSISYVMRLQRIMIPASVTVIEEGAFANSFAMNEIYVDDNNTVYYDKGGVLFSRADDALIQYPADRKNADYTIDDEVKAVAASAFADAEHLENVIIGKGVRKIGNSAFERCPSLKRVAITGEIEQIGKYAFKDCINLEKMILLSGLVPEIEPGIFNNVGSNFRIFVPGKYIRNYLRVIEWKEYHYLIQELEEE